MNTYELTVYHTVNNCGYSILRKTFTTVAEMIGYCMDFDNSNDDLLFDVWSPDRGQFNINEAVCAAKLMRDALAGEEV